MKVFIGLGNKGDKYNNTRHNVGKDFLLWFSDKNNFSDFEFDKYSNCNISHGIFNGEEIEIVIPETYMNVSGEAVCKYVRNQESGIRSQDIFVFHDDVDMNFGEVKLKEGESGSGGHNGINSLFDNLKFKDFNRVKIGIIPKKLFGGFKKPSKDKVSNFVLSRFGAGERKQLESVFEKVEDLIK